MTIAQDHPRKLSAAGGLAAGIALAAGVVLPLWEGERHEAYMPIPGDRWTICEGETAGVHEGDVATHEQCVSMLDKSVRRRVAEMQKCVKVQVSEKTAAALISLGYNIGSANFCRSAVVRNLNAGLPVRACAAFDQWRGVKRGSRYIVIPGLVRRRAAERKLCEEGLA